MKGAVRLMQSRAQLNSVNFHIMLAIAVTERDNPLLLTSYELLSLALAF
jgi:hypothetical protein